MSAVEMVVNMYRAMNMEEKKDLMFELSALAVKDGLVSEADIESKPKVSAKKKRGGWSPRSGKTWAKSVTGYDPTKKAVMRIEGNWVKDVATEVPDNGYYIVAWRDPKHYILCRNDGGGASVVENNGDEVEIVGTVIARHDSFKDLDASVKQLF